MLLPLGNYEVDSQKTDRWRCHVAKNTRREELTWSPADCRTAHQTTLDDGSWLARIVPTSGPNRQTTEPLRVRVIDYTIDNGRDNPEQHRLPTITLDPEVVSASDFAALYAQRWEIENTSDELKTHQHGTRAALRSKSPDLVELEIWGCSAPSPDTHQCGRSSWLKS